MYIPALILFEINSFGFSTNLSIMDEPDLLTTTPYLEGSSTFVTAMVPSPPWDRWKSLSCSNGKCDLDVVNSFVFL